MSDNYIQWCEVLYLPTPEVAQWAADLFTFLNDTADGDIENPLIPAEHPEFRDYIEDLAYLEFGTFDWSPAESDPQRGIVLCSEESGNLEATLEAIKIVFKHFNLPDIFSFSWSETCSRSQIGEFSGGAAAVSQHGVRTENTVQMQDRLVAQLTELRESKND